MYSSTVLVHYNPRLSIVVSSDASPYGIGSVPSHHLPDGSERPVAFVSRTLSSAEKKYAQLEKEALSLVFGITKFHKSLYGREFVLQSDHKPLIAGTLEAISTHLANGQCTNTTLGADNEQLPVQIGV